MGEGKVSNSVLSTQVNILRDQLLKLGYSGDRGAVVSNYPFITPDGPEKATLLAFATPQIRDISTSCIAVQSWPNGGNKQTALNQLSYMGVPMALLALPEQVEFWSISRPGLEKTPAFPFHVSNYDSGDLTDYFSRSGRELSPEILFNAKKGGRQLSLFDLDPSLEAFARDITQKALVDRFEDAYNEVFKRLGVKGFSITDIDRLAVAVLAACILQDKLSDRVDYLDLQTRDVRQLLISMRQHFPDHFKNIERNLFGTDEWNQIDLLYQNLRDGFTYRSLTNDMLAYFYENTLVKAKEFLRRELGIYYTPRHITERILKRLPIEDLQPEERTVLDGTCGSGNLLLAAYDRLSCLLPAHLSPEERHVYLRKHIIGIDRDDFACDVARLSLLLYNLPMGDSWNIKQGNIHESDIKSLFGKSPRIIVGNPPFNGLPSKGAQVEVAADILDKYLDWLPSDGLLGIVVPLTFLHNTRSNTRRVRERLLKSCDILEIWHLPENTFSASNIAIGIILARKLPAPRTSTFGFLSRIDEVQKSHKLLFEQYQQVTTSHLAHQEQWLSRPDYEMHSSPFDHIWRRIERQFVEADPNWCIIRDGMQPGVEGNRTHFSDEDKGKGWRPVLRHNKDSNVLTPFAIYWENQVRKTVRNKEPFPSKYIKYPSEGLKNERNPEHFAQASKVVINAARNPSNPWRIIAAIDKNQLVVTENFQYALARKSITVEELTTIFNSMLINAWFASRNYQRHIRTIDLQKIPIAPFTKRQKSKIGKVVQMIADLKQDIFRKDSEIRQNITLLDEMVFDAYGITPKERNQLKTWMNQYQRPGVEWENIQTSPSISLDNLYGWRRQRCWRFSGEVEAVNPAKESVFLWVQGRTKLLEIHIPDTMPGWALRPKAAFLAAIPWEQRYEIDLTKVSWLDFEPLDYGYLSDEELTSLLSSFNNRKE